MSMFEKAVRQKLRFESPMGLMTVEDVWSLPLKHRTKFDLDTLAKNLNRQVKEHQEESFVSKPSVANTTLALRFEIVKYVIQVLLEEKEAREKRAEKEERKRKILEIMDRKQDQELEGMSLDQLEALLRE